MPYLVRVFVRVGAQRGKLVARVSEQVNLLAPKRVAHGPEQGLTLLSRGCLQQFAEVHAQNVIIVHSANKLPAVRQLPIFFVQPPFRPFNKPNFAAR
jgi:hypothetical protein